MNDNRLYDLITAFGAAAVFVLASFALGWRGGLVDYLTTDYPNSRRDVVLAREENPALKRAQSCEFNTCPAVDTYAKPFRALMFSDSIELSYEGDFVYKLSLLPRYLEDIVDTRFDGGSGRFLVDVADESLAKKLDSFVSKIERYGEFEINGEEKDCKERAFEYSELDKALKEVLGSRLKGDEQSGVIDLAEFVKDKPCTKGDLADEYIEVDKSLQRLFVWKNGEVINDYIISTGKSGPTYNGFHYIKNHIDNPWSPVASVWTPYWMAFAYNEDARAWLGFHELPYWDGPNGTKIRRSFDTLGKPVTGGCIQLDIGDAEALYNWAKDGTLVFIHD